MAEEQPLVLPRRRQPGEVQRHQGRLGRQRDEPGQRLRRSRHSRPEYKTSNWGVEGGYQTSKATFSLRWDYSKFENANGRSTGPTRSSARNQLDTTYLAPDNTFNKFTVTGNYRDLPWRSVISARYT